ncbi:hypothetical protein BJY22_005418 [Kribbella shirazensis]|uniref:Uncharacterized protein n=1 Tax=Kribbella shirazensis TaxID=1105143 RepID=A0A7X5VF95_9ACTN|nr:hypothetical protein [Kribbella shirazensis]
MDAVPDELGRGRADELEVRPDPKRAIARGSAQSTTTAAIGPVSR